MRELTLLVEAGQYNVNPIKATVSVTDANSLVAGTRVTPSPVPAGPTLDLVTAQIVLDLVAYVRHSTRGWKVSDATCCYCWLPQHSNHVSGLMRARQSWSCTRTSTLRST